MINTTAEYALRAVVFLAAKGRMVVGREDISSATQIPLNYLVKVMKSLDEAGIVQSQRGPGGGYRLVCEADELSAYEVVTAVSAFPRIESCPLGIAEHMNLCPLHSRLDAVSALAEEAYRQTLVSELLPGRASGIQCSFPTPK